MEVKLVLNDYIPPDFDLKKYEELASYKAKDWLANIIARDINLYDSEMLDEIEQLTGARLEIFSDDITINLKYGSKWKFPDIGSIAFQLINTWYNKEKVESLSIGQSNNLFGQLYNHHEVGHYFKKLLLRKEQDAPLFDKKWIELCFSPVRNYQHSYETPDYKELVTVDLSQPDNVIRDSFDKWLSQARDRISPSQPIKRKEISQAKFRRWFESRAMPYFDLLKWNKLEGRQTIPHEIAGQIIFPDMSKNDFRNRAGIIADTTIKNMKEMLCPAVIELLVYQVHQEILSSSEEK